MNIQNKSFNQKQKMYGATIIEVMISVFLLAFGILALMLAQIRSVSSITEAENRTLVAQAAEALAEGMQINPTLSTDSNQLVTIKYDEYTNHRTKKTGPVSNQTVKSLGNTTLTKEELATLQINNFIAALNQIPDVYEMHYAICPGENNLAEPTMAPTGGSFNANCAPNNTTEPGAVIKVAWQMQNSNNRNSNEKMTYTYMLKVRG